MRREYVMGSANAICDMRVRYGPFTAEVCEFRHALNLAVNCEGTVSQISVKFSV